jgi:hypothetical protein
MKNDINFLSSTTHNVAWLQSRYLDDELEIKPPFQRNPVWAEKQKSYLIDTILHGYPIPELYMQEYTDGKGNQVYIVVDGQQRVRSCLEYLRGDYAILAEDSDPRWSGKKFEQLTEAQKKKIYNYNFVVRQLPELKEIELRAVFKRINRNVVALNRQELRHATYWGQFIQAMESIADEEAWLEFGVFTPNDVRRMLDIEFISEIAVAHLHGPQNKKDSLDRWYQAYEAKFPQREGIESDFRAVLGELQNVIPAISSSRWKKKSDFYSLCLLLLSQTADFPLPASRRKKLGNGLLEFGTRVSAYLSDPDGNKKMSPSVRAYAGAVSRAASDLAQRKARQAELEKLYRASA